MRILIDLTSLAHNFSGIERYAASISYEMILNDSNNGYILLFKSKVHPMFRNLVKKNNVTHYVLPGRGKLFFNQVTLPLFIYRIKADWYLFLAFPVPIFLFKNNMVSTIHDLCAWDCPETMNGLSSLYYRFSVRLAMLKCSNIITISEFSKKRIIERFKYDASKIWLIYCGVDKKFKTSGYTKNEIAQIKKKYHLPDDYILSLSTIEPRKNLKLLIEAYIELFSKGYDLPKLVLSGRKAWEDTDIYVNMSSDMKRRIIFTGFVDEQDLPCIYKEASLFVFPSVYEGFGIPPLEALASGTSVLCSDAASLPEILGDNVTYFKSRDLADLKKNILIARNKTKVAEETRSQLYSWKREAKKLLNNLSK